MLKRLVIMSAPRGFQVLCLGCTNEHRVFIDSEDTVVKFHCHFKELLGTRRPSSRSVFTGAVFMNDRE